MKKIAFFIFTVFIFSQIIQAQSANNQLNLENPNAKEKIEWKSKIVDLGEVKYRVPATAIFEFINAGEKPVLITNVRASCGCTNPKYPKEPIQPGQTAQISAVYNAASMGSFNKSITVNLNIQDGTHILILKGVVVANKQE